MKCILHDKWDNHFENVIHLCKIYVHVHFVAAIFYLNKCIDKLYKYQYKHIYNEIFLKKGGGGVGDACLLCADNIIPNAIINM